MKGFTIDKKTVGITLTVIASILLLKAMMSGLIVWLAIISVILFLVAIFLFAKKNGPL